MKFEYDPAKSKGNKQKHNIDFIAAQELWEDMNLLEVPAKNIDETRFLVIGKIAEKHWSAIITYHTAVIRIISVRRSRKEEVALYES